MKKTIITLIAVIALHTHFYAQISETNLPKIESLIELIGKDLTKYESYIGQNYTLESRNVINRVDTEYRYKSNDSNANLKVSCVVHNETNQVVEMWFETDSKSLIDYYIKDLKFDNYNAKKCLEESNEKGITCYHMMVEQKNGDRDFYSVKFIEEIIEKPSLQKTYKMKFLYTIR